MSSLTLCDIAHHFCVSDIPGATIPATRLSKLLDSIYRGHPLTEMALEYLLKQNLNALHQLATGQITYETYMVAAGAAEQDRKQAAETQRLAKEAARLARETEWERKYRLECEAAEAARLVRETERVRKYKLECEAAEAARIARESDPKYIAQKKSQALRDKYGMAYIDQPLFPRLMAILKGVDSGNRLAEDDVVWLKTEAEEYFTDELQEAYHLREAEFYAGEYRRTRDPWNAVNASGHFRKCSRPEAALELLDSASGCRLKDPKIKSAMSTTRGGVMRDMGQLDEARQLGETGHELKPRDFRPCTLLGAVHMELGNFDEAHDWYNKAEERGASERSIDADLRSIFQRADQGKRDSIKAFLLAKDPNRYRWVNDNRYRNS